MVLFGTYVFHTKGLLRGEKKKVSHFFLKREKKKETHTLSSAVAFFFLGWSGCFLGGMMTA